MNPFTERYKEMGEEIEFIKLRKAIRVNTKKISPEKLQERLEKKHIEMERIPFVKNGFWVKAKFNLVSTPEYLLGLFYFQEAAAQIPVEVLNPKNLTLDCCAAPGGKTTQIAEYAPVIAVESNRERFVALENNIERLGLRNCIAYLMDLREVDKRFSSILLDAPCSGNYMLEDHWMQKNSLKRINERAEKQKELIAHALSLLEKDGIIVYSTCSIEPEENEFVIQFALDHFPVKVEKINCIGDPGLTKIFGKKLDPSIAHCRRLWPHKTKTIGFFIARLKKC
ncbi:MAG TPA: RsmB/NOP family class I SAM-dependent RNA methyltransferase [Nanoarchaeota archaeon]|nr:RsmB/NOP family class I SAM-dependent RNA methyltransferase [Nanoarchaeota archaeon]HIH59493.1 RsmB/NOP family class I SAM-dependent RNA methyltransferase [Nanoarchaeota archaeon]HII14244.1 RsmB/NOP family class I SAM-dependent RNA methyltransferase [Nanoarchaeota archaeon]HIJ04616.1 RsmB/NOP family class I SAM-dependent RNA methyltransferase [Nanoarchaeota archaeon]